MKKKIKKELKEAIIKNLEKMPENWRVSIG